ncbi:hypothetical protein DXU04_35535 [Bradyrhizobium diazoefficiens]|uniref:Uncharacterized protein n=1 Tax=Bradyrhizobium diazoefficiens SEMIA 5080 TaxID=754504 RepID=A0A837CL53_9BRAD|nr:hypothetical protein BJA5080_04512 [Bradyrhizobium diazoefficiens SEMIA 5080]QHP70780.1 hypothetical protein EI171_27945 [Bradyrhizobium sp. LCT2]
MNDRPPGAVLFGLGFTKVTSLALPWISHDHVHAVGRQRLDPCRQVSAIATCILRRGDIAGLQYPNSASMSLRVKKPTSGQRP